MSRLCADMRDEQVGEHWGVLNKLVARFAVEGDWDPWRLWRLPALGHPELLPHVGPAVYAVLGDNRCMYVGQTQDLHGRFRSHLAVPYRRERWLSMAAIVLKPSVPNGITNRLEREAAYRLRPVDGSCWPRNI